MGEFVEIVDGVGVDELRLVFLFFDDIHKY